MDSHGHHGTGNKKSAQTHEERTTPGEHGVLIDAGDIAEMRPFNFFNKCLINVIYKPFTKVITTRISDSIDSIQSKEQASFRNGFSTKDHIHTLIQTMESIEEYGKSLCVAFDDYEKASDSVHIAAILEVIRKQGVEEAY
ncbi:uncharacterized protein LOC134762257 [Penaeus indicus]|uniref:uncharacterized protein LOC134762257 n=1 Tax=Penaeus indicus TaxID=29960 RepID=UPI00300C2E1A